MTAPPPAPAAAPDGRGGDRGSGILACAHGAGGGSLDESARRLSHQELAVAQVLVAEGHAVRSLPEWPWSGPTADLEACGRRVEVKSFVALADHPKRALPTAESVCNKLIDAARQGDVALIWGCGSGLSAGRARAGVAMFSAKGGGRRVDAVRILGDGFDLSWSGPELAARAPGRMHRATPGQLGAARRPPPGLGLGR